MTHASSELCKDGVERRGATPGRFELLLDNSYLSYVVRSTFLPLLTNTFAVLHVTRCTSRFTVPRAKVRSELSDDGTLFPPGASSRRARNQSRLP